MEEIVSDSLKKQGKITELLLPRILGRIFCPNCNIELDTNLHLFCFKCGKSVEEMVSVDLKQGNDDEILIMCCAPRSLALKLVNESDDKPLFGWKDIGEIVKTVIYLSCVI